MLKYNENGERIYSCQDCGRDMSRAAERALNNYRGRWCMSCLFHVALDWQLPEEYDAADDEAVHDKNLIRDRREEAKKLSGGEY